MDLSIFHFFIFTFAYIYVLLNVLVPGQLGQLESRVPLGAAYFNLLKLREPWVPTGLADSAGLLAPLVWTELLEFPPLLLSNDTVSFLSFISQNRDSNDRSMFHSYVIFHNTFFRINGLSIVTGRDCVCVSVVVYSQTARH